ncbi:MAG TPA: LamG domain-containing protein, partial [Candidatus Paceibacterota bacterium]
LMNKSIGIYQADVPQGLLGTASTTYVSIADPTATTTLGTNCGGIGLTTSSLPSGWSYHCASSSTLSNIDGTGWIPINFSQISSRSPLSRLPTDPINTSSTGSYYTYTMGGSWELTGAMESQKQADTETKDGGLDPARYETGSNLTLSPFVGGMVGYWSFEEGSGSTVPDQSGMGNNGSWSGSGSHYAAGKVGGMAGQFSSATTDYVEIPSAASLRPTSQVTVIGWFNPNALDNGALVGRTGNSSPNEVLFLQLYQANSSLRWYINGTAENYGAPVAGQWQHFAAVYDGTAATKAVYLNGTLTSQVSQSGALNTSNSYPLRIGTYYYASPSNLFSGKIDDVRMYNRALTAAEISAIYSATK